MKTKNSLKAYIYIKEMLHRIVDIPTDQDKCHPERVYINRNEIGREISPRTIPEYLLIGESAELSNNQKMDVVYESNSNKYTIDSLFENNEIRIELEGNNKRVEMIHIYETKHPLHPWDSFDFFEYENDLEDFGKLIYAYGKSENEGEELKIVFIINPFNSNTIETIEKWNEYRKKRILRKIDNIYFTANSIFSI